MQMHPDMFTVSKALFHADVMEVALPDGEYWVIAVCGGQFLTVREGDSSPTVYYIHHESLEPRASFTSFEQALRYFQLRCTANE